MKFTLSWLKEHLDTDALPHEIADKHDDSATASTQVRAADTIGRKVGIRTNQVTVPTNGNVVLWMQPDGTLNPSPTPTEEPDPSDSGPSYWLARTIWALGEGYAAFRGADPAFADAANSWKKPVPGA